MTQVIRRTGFEGLLGALIEEARRRARRRRRIYAGLGVSIAAIGAIVFAVLQSPANPESGLPALPVGPNAQLAPSAQGPRFLAGGHVAHAFFRLEGRRGNVLVVIHFPDSGERIWEIPRGQFSWQPTGPYARMTGEGRHVEVGGHETAWYARLVGYVRTKGGPRQHVVVKLRGRPAGTFVITPTSRGPLERDSGTQTSWTLG